MPQTAEGIPDRSNYGDYTKLPVNTLLDYIRQLHLADKAGPHTDIRFGNKEHGLHSWAVRKGLPEPKKKHLAVHQPVHSHDYGGFEGEITEGYGKGTVKKEDTGKLILTKVEPNKIHMVLASKRMPERYVLVKPEKFGEKDWLLMNVTPTQAVPYEKVPYKSVPAEKVE